MRVVSPAKLVLSSLLVADLILHAQLATAFASNLVGTPRAFSKAAALPPRPCNSNRKAPATVRMMMTPSVPALRIRGGGAAGEASSAASSATAARAFAPGERPSEVGRGTRIRIDAFDSMRFFLILNIVLGHFIIFASPSDFVFKLVSQHNASVGAFFALSGYVAAYTSTEIGQRAPSQKLISTPSQKWILSRIFGYYPLHLFVLLIFSPMFVYVDMKYNGLFRTAFNAVLSVTLTQAWFPSSAEVWNAPTWYLSALSFITACMPFALVPISTMTKPQLRKTSAWLFLLYLLPKIGYWWDFDTLFSWEGIMAPKMHPNWSVFNMLRFSPLFLVAEVLLGAVACRLVMLDNAVDEERPPYTNALSTFLPLSLIFGGVWARAAGWVPPVSDLLFRSVWFVPLFLRFLMAAHRNTVRRQSDWVTKFLSSPFLVSLGNLSFPIYIVHGPIGQMFYKKIVATRLWGSVLKGPQTFFMYLAVTLIASYALQRGFMQNRDISYFSGRAANSLSEIF
jgi:peptidoglycan/LPS O-acetylase OafA/YrhL